MSMKPHFIVVVFAHKRTKTKFEKEAEEFMAQPTIILDPVIHIKDTNRSRRPSFTYNNLSSKTIN